MNFIIQKLPTCIAIAIYIHVLLGMKKKGYIYIYIDIALRTMHVSDLRYFSVESILQVLILSETVWLFLSGRRPIAYN